MYAFTKWLPVCIKPELDDFLPVTTIPEPLTKLINQQ